MRKRLVFFILVFFAALWVTSCDDKGKISLADPIINLKVGESKKINYEITKGREVEFSLPNEEIAKISGDNIVGVSAGEVELTATIKGTTISAKATVKVTNVEADGVTIAGDASGLVGASIQLTATISPENTTDKTVTWSSSDETIATVDQTGKVSLLKVGEVTITATIGDKTATHAITVKPILAESITISGDASGLVGGEIQLTATVLPENTTDKTVTWSSSDETIATVDQTGKVSLLKVGEVTITATIGDKTATHAITVNPVLVESVTISGAVEGLIGGEIQLTATVLPENTTDKTVTWSSSDETIATVDQTGKVSLLALGEVTIKAVVGSKEDTHVITVNPVLVESVTISGAIEGLIGGEIQLTATVLPENTTDKTVTWSSSDETIATVDQTGKVSLLVLGEVTIKAVVGSKEDTHVITVKPILAESITISGDASGLVGGEIQLTATVLPENTTDKTVTWSSSDETLATVDQTGKVTLLVDGEVTITAKVGETTKTHTIVISDIPVTSIEITGPSTIFIGDTATLELTILPVEANYRKVTWSVDISAYATVENGVVTAVRKGKVVISATIDEVIATHEITIDIAVAKNGDVKYSTIQAAIDAATAGDVINVNHGTFDEILTIDKAITLKGFADKQSILTNKITINTGVNGVTIDGFKMTGKAQVYNAGIIEDFTFTNNYVYDTDLAASAYVPNNRTNVNAIIQIYSGAGMDKVGGITIEHNVFNNIKSDIIAMDRTKVGKEINIRHNEFRNFGVGAIRFDGGYNNGTYNITDNTFENDVKQAEAAIVFRAYSSSSGNVQTINISNNIFKNIGNEGNNRNGTYPGSAVISTSTYNSKTIVFNITNNQFVNTHNSVHLRKNESTTFATYGVTVSGNTFTDPTGYTFFEDGNIAKYELNTYLDRLGVEVAADRVILTEDPAFRHYTIAAPVLESFTIEGAATGSVTDEVLLELVAVPPYYEFSEVTWTSSDDELATVTNGVVKLLAVGDVVITAKVGDLTVTHDINITAKVAAKIGDVEYATIQAAIDAATAGDVINVNHGTFDEILTIDKAITLKGFADKQSILTNKITINTGVNGVTIDGFKMTGKAQVYNAGVLEDFTFTNNYVYDTDLAATAYAPSTRTNVNAIIQIYSGAGMDKVGGITIEHNVFNNIKSDIIAMDRTKVGKEINIRHNEFRNFGVGAIRFDGGYNNGTYNITDNTFENDVKQAEAAIVFRAYSSSSGNVQTVNIVNNIFKNIGNETNNPAGTHPASAVIATSTYNENTIAFSITNNQFINTHNSIHLRKNSTKGADVYNVTVSNNTFVAPTGYIYNEDGNIVKYEFNTYLDVNNNQVPVANIEHITTASLTKVSYVAEYAIVYYTFNPETEKYDVVYEIKKDTVGKTIKLVVPTKDGYYTDEPVLEGIVTADGSLLFDVIYHLIEIDPNAFYYQLELNGGNFEYETRRDLVDDFINDYNTVNNKSYTLETLGMNIWGDVDYHNVFYHTEYREKWLWLAEYLGQVGSSANKKSAQDIVTYQTREEWLARSGNWPYAFSYEVRAFLKEIHWTANANWPTADYSQIERANGFWPLYATYKIPTQYLSGGAEETLPIPYKEGFNFAGWYLAEDLSGEPITVLTETAKVYAKYEEKTPVTALAIANPITEMLKEATHQLEVTITPADAFNKTLIYYTSDIRVATVSDAGLITAMNEGTVTIKVTNYNGTVETTMTFTVYPGNDIKVSFSEEYTGSLQVNDEFTMDVTGIGKDNASVTYTYQVPDETVLEFTSPNKFKALKVGSTTIDIYNGSELVKSYKVIVQGAFSDADRVDQLLELLAAGNNPVAQGLNVILVHQSTNEHSQPKHESVNAYLFDDFVVDRTTYLANPEGRTSGIKTSTEFVLVHDTANVNGGLVSHGNFFKSATNVSIHYVVGDGGILQSLEDKYIAWHAGDGTGTVFNWLPTGVTVIDPNLKPEFDISADGYFMINGEKTTVVAPTDNGRILDKSYFTYIGPTWRIVGNQYELGTHYFTRKQQTYGVIASHGGNNNSIGIEMCVNTNGDSIDTLQRTAKLVANLLEQYDLPNSRVIMHNTTDGKADPYMINNTLYNGSWYFPRFMEHVTIEREVLKNYSDATITFSSESPLVSNTGRIIAMPDETTFVEYTITVKIGDVTKSITLVSVVPGKHTWSQNSGNFKPLIRWAKADYRVDMREIPQ